MTKEETINQCEEYVLHTYNRFPLVIDHGEGTTVYDTDGKPMILCQESACMRSDITIPGTMRH